MPIAHAESGDSSWVRRDRESIEFLWKYSMSGSGRQPWFPMFAESSLWKISPRRAAYGRGSDLTLSTSCGQSWPAALAMRMRSACEPMIISAFNMDKQLRASCLIGMNCQEGRLVRNQPNALANQKGSGSVQVSAAKRY